MALASGVVPEDWRSAMIILCTRVKMRRKIEALSY